MTPPAHDRFRLLFERSSDPHFIVVDEKITDCNDATLQLLKCATRDEFLNIHPAVLSPTTQPDGRDSMEKSAEMDRLAREKGFHRFEWTHRKFNGEEFPVQVTLNALTIDGRPGMIAVWHDLTEVKRNEEELRRAYDKMKRDLQAASTIQKGMLPVSSPLVKGFRAAWAFRPCEELGGDILNVFPLDEKHVGMYVLDVTGHGVSASLLSTAASHFLSPYSETSFVRNSSGGNRLAPARPAEVADKLNRHFCSNPDVLQFFTLLYGVLNVETREFCYICAGHPLPIVLSRDGKPRQAAGSGLPIGVEQDFSYAELCLKMKAGDKLFIYSDGVTEVKNIDRAQYGDERLLTLLEKVGRTPLAEGVEAVVQAAEAWCRPEVPDDDITFLACELS